MGADQTWVEWDGHRIEITAGTTVYQLVACSEGINEKQIFYELKMDALGRKADEGRKRLR